MQEEAKRGKNVPVLWQSDVYVTDANLNIIRKSTVGSRRHTFESFMMRFHAHGCAMVMNAKLCEVSGINTYYAHDVQLFLNNHLNGGSYIFNPNAYIMYRSHGNNTAGGSAMSTVAKLRREIRNLLYTDNIGAKVAERILHDYGDKLNARDMDTLITIARHKTNWLFRLKIFFLPRFVTGKFSVTVIDKLRGLLGKI